MPVYAVSVSNVHPGMVAVIIRTVSHKGHHVSEAASGTWRQTRKFNKKITGSGFVRRSVARLVIVP